ncbi:MAG TPA: N-acetylmuramoyl-L-alanine amidase CwlD [Firmicutes bacterium]|nr:N-acetylmuramoyl-L-alanine amidase CwlD [Bacillota bacterium]
MRIIFLAAPGLKRRLYFILVFYLLILILLPVARQRLAGTQPALQTGLLLSGKVFAIDPGHGGYDPGVMRNGIAEKDVALEISLFLRAYLQSAGARVVMTRETDRDLLLPAAGPKKQQDMKNRMRVINGARPDLLLSIHVNSITSPVWRGAQVFHKAGEGNSKVIAETIQEELRRILANTDRAVKPGNYYVLNEAECPAVLVECGFLSNAEEARLLTDRTYQSRLAWAVYAGLLRYYHGQLPGS